MADVEQAARPRAQGRPQPAAVQVGAAQRLLRRGHPGQHVVGGAVGVDEGEHVRVGARPAQHRTEFGVGAEPRHPRVQHQRRRPAGRGFRAGAGGEGGRGGQCHVGEVEQAGAVAVMLRAGLTTPRALEIAAHGIAAQGVITEVRPTGNLVDGNPEMDVEVAVTRPDGGVFHTRTVKRLPARLSTSLQAGRVVTVHYIPGREDEITIQTPANPGVR
ncbi:hypothetical protein [Nocardiopsis sp. CC223A]|uniref:hypothetical protein n=1 Tax=Nocardiopsis sp. CC223A TaxID=3044051 RepID=UPI00278BBBB0|nr:hypothetical protein [Nocardiopsis sp. CC223A]